MSAAVAESQEHATGICWRPGSMSDPYIAQAIYRRSPITKWSRVRRSRAAAEAKAREFVVKHPDAVAVEICSDWMPRAYVVRAGTDAHVVDIEKDTIDGEPGLLLGFYPVGSDHDGPPQEFAVAPDANRAIEIAERLLREDGLKTGATVTISSAKAVDPARLTENKPLWGADLPSLRHTVKVEFSGNCAVTDELAAYAQRRIVELRTELDTLEKLAGRDAPGIP